MAGYQSTVPDAINALVALFKASPQLAGMGIYDGPEVSASTELQVVAVGFTGERMSTSGAYPEPSQPVVEAENDVEGLAVNPVSERYTIRCCAACLDGGESISAARTGAYQVLAACGSVILADKTLGGVVQLATLGAGSLLQDQVPRGARAIVDFSVSVQAFSKKV